MMKHTFLYLTLIISIYSNSSPAMDEKPGEETITSANKTPTVQIIHENPIAEIMTDHHTTTSVRDVEAQVNLNEDVPGCADNYFRFSIAFWQIGGGWIDLATTLTTSTSTLLSGLATMGGVGEDLKFKLGVAAVVCGSIGTSLHVLKNYSLQAIHERRNSLREVIGEYHRENR